MLNQVICGDCLEVMPHIASGSVDMVLCDLPYGTTSNKWDSVLPLDQLWKEWLRVIKKPGAIVLTSAQPFTATLVNSNLPMFRYALVWKKSRASNQTMAKAQPLRFHEDVCVFSQCSAHNMAAERMTYNPQGLVYVGKITKQGAKISDNLGEGRARATEYFQEWGNYPGSILEFASEGNTKHPTQKPVALWEYLIRTYTNEGDTVLDNCCGSGTTGVACQNTGRNFIQIDLEEYYCQIARERLLLPAEVML